MDLLLWCLIWALRLERWPSLTLRPNLFLSLYRVKAKWSVGWSVANVSKEVVPGQLCSTIDSPRAIQTSIWDNRNNFYINQNRPKHLWPKIKKSKILTCFEICQLAWKSVCWHGSFGFQMSQRDFAPFSTIDTFKHQQRPIQTNFQSTQIIPGVFCPKIVFPYSISWFRFISA